MIKANVTLWGLWMAAILLPGLGTIAWMLFAASVATSLTTAKMTLDPPSKHKELGSKW